MKTSKEEKRNLLLIDDETWFLESLKEILADEYEVHTAAGGKEGVQKYLDNMVDLILLDLAMPEMDGIEVLQRIREVNPWIPVIIMTGHSTIERAETAASLGVQGYIKKPFDSEVLKEKIKEILAIKELGLVTVGLPSMVVTSTAELKEASYKVMRYLHNNYHRRLSLKEIAKESNQSVSNLCRTFKEGTGVTVLEYLQNLRITMAKRLIENTNYSIATVAKLIGMEDESYFSRIFKREVGTSPNRFRKSGHFFI
ncbi:MAG: response regulator transcription factor [Deltaproteobacteria bacterium]|nr:response regulator transcription factor [Deltaproteobacteria bacterium]